MTSKLELLLDKPLNWGRGGSLTVPDLEYISTIIKFGLKPSGNTRDLGQYIQVFSQYINAIMKLMRSNNKNRTANIYFAPHNLFDPLTICTEL